MEVTSGREQGTARRTSAAKRNNVQWMDMSVAAEVDLTGPRSSWGRAS